jgi:hypothetical protein
MERGREEQWPGRFPRSPIVNECIRDSMDTLAGSRKEVGIINGLRTHLGDAENSARYVMTLLSFI